MLLPLPTLALDYGTKRIGVAMSYGTLAEPIEILGNNAQAKTAIDGVVLPGSLQRIQALCVTLKPQQIIIGVSEGAMAELAQRFANLVQAQCQLPVVSWDETLSSVTVAARLKERPGGFKPRGQHIDAYAAAVILEDWLESQGV